MSKLRLPAGPPGWPGVDPLGAREDDGFLLAVLFKPSTNTSLFAVYDATTMNRSPISLVELPVRVPYGFHSNFFPASQINSRINSQR